MLNEDSGILVSDGRPPAITISTLPDLLLHSNRQHRKPDAFKFKRNSQWIDVSTDEFLLRVEELFFALRTLGLRPGDRVAIVSENRLEWAIADYATLCGGAISVPIYPTLSPSQVEALLLDSKPTVVFVSTPDILKKVTAARKLARPRYVVAFDPAIYQPDVMRIDALYEMGRQSTYDYPGEFQRSAMAVKADDLATIIYTSGTSGTPKGAMLTHRNLVTNVLATSQRLTIGPDDLSLSFLPLSHILQRHADYASMLAGATTAYAESVLTVAEDMRAVRPTFAAGVPRFFEKIYAHVFNEVSRSSSVGRAVFEKALQIGLEHVRRGHRKMSLKYRAADRLVFRHIRAGLGGRVQFFISGGAALNKDIAEFFWAIGLPIFEGYGLTETSPVITLNGPGNVRIGSVGRTVGDQEIRIADDGEILVRGSNVTSGYYGMEYKTREALAGGWFHTGDIGAIDGEGFLQITDRKKDLIVTSSGKNVAPQPIENRLRLIPYFQNVVVIGDRRNFVSALIVPNYEALSAYARAHNIEFGEPEELLHNAEIYELAMSEIDRRTQDLAPFEKIRKIAFLEQDFTIDGGELTPTMKVRRSAIQKKFEAAIDRLYAA
jgi:long-chain acyl-CoA synthetase